MGFISECRDAGLPEALLIPVRPPFRNEKTGEMDGGKAPAVPDGAGSWMGLDKWSDCSTSWDIKEYAEQYGANCGLVLGSFAKGQNYTYAAIDIDLDPGQEVHRNRLLNAFQLQFPYYKMLIRETVPYRALLLLKVNDTGAGHKTIFTLSQGDNKLGKIEILTTGQQCVIAGQHPIGGLIQWSRPDDPQTYRAPPIRMGMPEFPTFTEVGDAVHAWLNTLSKAGYYYESMSTNRKDAKITDLVPQWLTVDTLLKVISDTPNTKDIEDRDYYVSFMQAIAACKAGIEAHHGPLPHIRAEQIGMRAAEWAASWPGHVSPTEALISEKSKWDNDWSKNRGEFSIGWTRLIQLATEFGNKDAPFVDAQAEFTGSVKPNPANSAVDAYAPLSGHKPNDVNKLYVPNASQAESAIADYIRFTQRFDQEHAYLPELGWVWWDSIRRGWRFDSGGTRTLNRVEQEMNDYVAKFGNGGAENEAWKPGEVNRLLSLRMRDNITEFLESHVRWDEEDRKDTRYHLQTPLATYDLTTLTKIPDGERKRMFDVRYTAVEPVFDGPTPNMDKVLLGLAEGDEEVVNWVWHYLGYCLLGSPREDCFLVIWGPGGNGKSKLMGAIEACLGAYQKELNSKILMDSGKNLHPTSLNRLRGVRLAKFSELPSRDKWNEHLLKQMTGGDRIQARNMMKDETDFRCEAGLLFATNELPKFEKVNRAILRRYRLIGTTWQPTNPDNYLGERLEEEAPAILGKMMRYAQRVYNPAGGAYEHVRLPPVPPKMMAAQQDNLKANDPFFGWITSECEYGPGVAEEKEDLDELMNRYKAWLARNTKVGSIAGDILDEKTFTDGLANLGVSTRDAKGNKLRRTQRTGTDSRTVHFARGVKLKVRAVA